ncbi:MAG: DUF3536 domain-containing protein [Saprospirales bacterium]|nr:DUF3536 domain-containing protein [Saprospirales bacterium]MBK8491729.1 DUF3536 domain-containing protein [Saprospirales bacterium]
MNTSNKFLCIHGHFYQPPRENAWLEVIEMQDSAAPFHDWNERINFECYAPNTAARILDEANHIRKIVNNYTRISYNFGPTLLSWLEKADEPTYRSILNSDKISQAKYNGHGAAIAQVHSHLILPLANRRDKETQVIWGIRDFQHRYGRLPEGMWLSETAVDMETLEVLAENNIRYTILAPRQAKSIRRIGEEGWQLVGSETIDTRRPYLCKLASGKSIALFFYHGGVSQGVAFDGLLDNGKRFAERLLAGFDDTENPQLVHIATDGETYGHHHRYGEMALADCLNYIEENNLAILTNYGDFLDRFPPEYEAEIHENSSWSCAHGVERWRSNCGCETGSHPGWTQAWRGPLRDTLNWLRDQLIPIFEVEAGKLLKNVWTARNEYIRVMLNRDEPFVEAFIQSHAKRKLDKKEITRALRLLEMQRQALFMFTSCGWFFDEISGIETLQIMQYANRAIHFAKQVKGVDLHEGFLQRLEKAPSNVYPTGADAYRIKVMPAEVNLERVGMHYAVASLFEEEPERIHIFNYLAESDFFERRLAGAQRMAVGSTTVKSRTTLSEKRFYFAVLYLGQQNIIGNISREMAPEDFDRMKERLFDAFRTTNLATVIGIMQEYFGEEKYTIWNLFHDEMRKILEDITQKSYAQIDSAFREFYNDNYQLMSGMLQMGIPIPSAFRNAVQLVVNRDLHHFFENGAFYDVNELKHLVEELGKWSVELTQQKTFKLAVSERFYKELLKLDRSELSLPQLNRLNSIIDIVYKMGVKPNVWKIQNLYFSILKGFKNGDWVFASKEWEEAFLKLGGLLNVKI